MSKKLNQEAFSKIESQLTKKKVLTFNIDGEEYKVRVKCFLSGDDKGKILIDLAEMAEETEYPEIILFLVSLIETLTDIELGDDTETKVKILLILADADYLEAILGAIPKKVIQEVQDHLNLSAQLLPEIMKDLIMEEYRMREVEELNKEEE